MVEIREYNLSTGHVETIESPLMVDGGKTYGSITDAVEYIRQMGDHSTDHVMYAVIVEGSP